MKQLLPILLISLSAEAIPIHVPDPIPVTSENQSKHGFNIIVEGAGYSPRRVLIHAPLFIDDRKIDSFNLLTKDPNKYLLVPVEYKEESGKAIALFVIEKSWFDDFEIEIWYLNETGEFPDLEHKYKIDLEQFIK